MTSKQKIVIFQQNQSGAAKAAGIRKFGRDRFIVETVDIDTPLPPVVDDTGEYLPDRIEADLVLDFLAHPDLSMDLGQLCTQLGIPVVASGKKSRDGLVITPPTWCGLSRQVSLGHYSELFGAPAFSVKTEKGIITAVAVLRGAPCGATWQAAKKMIGLETAEAIVRMGLEPQFYCSADPAGWDPINGKSPVHFAGKVHSAALEKAIENADKESENK